MGDCKRPQWETEDHSGMLDSEVTQGVSLPG